MTTWIKDENGNRCSVEHFGSEEAAQKALDSLIGCKNCENCRDCSYCSDCSGCRDCSYCSYCRGCSGCRDCSYCSDCSYCRGCRDCSYCSYCRGCRDCSYCRGCRDCSYCRGCSYCSNKKNLDGEQPDFVIPKIPIIENIDQVIFEACSAPNALNMSSWHTCNTTHCRAGWVVHKAGEAGYALERFHNTALAAQLIYRESGSPINPSKFYETNDEAMADMRTRAGVTP